MPPRQLALFGHRLDSANLGVDALTRAHLGMLAEIAGELDSEIEATIFTWTDLSEVEFAPRLRVRQRAFSRNPRYFWWDWMRASHNFAHFDGCIDLSEGDSFSDIYGHWRAYIQTIDKFLVLRAGVPLIFAPMTVGPFRHAIWRKVARYLVRKAAAVFVRDSESLAFAQGSLARPEVGLASDLAFILPYSPPRTLRHDGLRIGLNISQLLWSGGYDRRNQFDLKENYPSLIRALVGQLAEMPGVELHFVPHVVAEDFPVEDDRRACREMHETFPGSVLAPTFRDSSEAKSYIASLDFFMGSRMHSCIAAFSSGVPVVPLAYSRKFGGLFSSLGYGHTVDLRECSIPQVLAKVDESLRRRAELREETVRGTKRALEKLQSYRECVRETLGGVR